MADLCLFDRYSDRQRYILMKKLSRAPNYVLYSYKYHSKLVVIGLQYEQVLS